MLTAKEKYRHFCGLSTRPLIFQTPQWLDAVAGHENWDVVISTNADAIVGAMPLVFSKKMGFTQITLPALTFYLGPIIIYPEDLLPGNKRSYQRKVLLELNEQIPNYSRFVTQTDFEFDYWLPFYWNGYQQTTRYTSILDTHRSEDDLLASFKPNTRKAIAKSKDEFSISLGDSPKAVFDLYQEDCARKKILTPVSESEISRMDRALAPTENRCILEAKNEKNEVIAALYLVVDHTYMHYVFGAVNFNFRDSGVMSLLLWNAILEAKKKDISFNFGGSMNQKIEQFFAGFRGEITPYMRITKVSHPILKPFAQFQQNY